MLDTLFKSLCNYMFNIKYVALNHNDGKEHIIVLGVTHMGVNRTENRSEQRAAQNHITKTLCYTYTNWSCPALDEVNNLCSPGKIISWLEPMDDIHLSKCQSVKTIKYTKKIIKMDKLLYLVNIVSTFKTLLKLLHIPVLCCLMAHRGFE